MNSSSRHRRRPMSAVSAGRPTSAGVGGADKPRTDAKFIADPDLWKINTNNTSPTTPHESSRRKRPTSAPVYKRLSADADYDHCDNNIISMYQQNCFVLFSSRPRSEGWPHHERNFSIYLCPLSF